MGVSIAKPTAEKKWWLITKFIPPFLGEINFNRLLKNSLSMMLAKYTLILSNSFELIFLRR